MGITKEQVLRAIEVIEKYKAQGLATIKSMEIDKDKRDIGILGLNGRAYNTLIDSNTRTIGELISINRRDLKKYRNMGRKGIIAINEAMKSNGINKEPFDLPY